MLILEQGAHQAADAVLAGRRATDTRTSTSTPGGRCWHAKELFATSEELFATLRPHPRLELAREQARGGRATPYQRVAAASLPRSSGRIRKQETPLGQTAPDSASSGAAQCCSPLNPPGRRESAARAVEPGIGLRPQGASPTGHAFHSERTRAGHRRGAAATDAFLLAEHVAVIPEAALLGGRVAQSAGATAKPSDGADAIIRNLAELTASAFPGGAYRTRRRALPRTAEPGGR